MLVYADEAVAQVFSGRLTAPDPVKSGILTGVFRETTAQATSYILEVQADGEPRLLLAPASSTSVGLSRAYIAALPTGSTSQLNIQWDEVPSGIMPILVDKEGSDIYDLQGRRCQPVRPGIYIQGGRKVIYK